METKQVVLQSKGAAFQVLRRGVMFAKTFRSIINSQMGTDIRSLSETFYLVCQVLSSWNKETLSLLMQSIYSQKLEVTDSALLSCSLCLPGPSQSHSPVTGSEPGQAKEKGRGHWHEVVPEVMEGVKVSSPLLSRCWFLRRKANSARDMQEQKWELRAEIQGNPKRGKSAEADRETLFFFKA